mmetsp:Transcript_11464/g.19038  ORF Transcript_11464/g.19038 Transcript_11464/m.19038 type:complete len:235 (-) Transcript_11464:43-747(-)|eukprot:CAMPEP_0181048150 /NCGR_PEP_ID=MMETSP1070-20121207/15276_1 /TAXON_ID=265543 /ORGANISM="Minutocellus polymorphus, Strain NH13" /LENGTH=234 /DNA_ID=CAMNT_0023126903 /DNA_START=84 /DNA_END=788 /DNA_ORIENTATION=+
MMMTKLSLLAAAVLAPTAVAFAPAARTNTIAPAFSQQTFEPARYVALYAEGDEEAVVDVPAPEVDDLTKAESLGRGAAKTKRGKRKGGVADESKAARKTAASLAPEETFYEGPPAITETIVPTISILTVVGIIPAAAAWARQAWVRYKITNRRVRVTSGVGGKDMAEIVYPDIIELRTAKRLFGDGDLVAFLRDGAKFEMRNIPNFDESIEYILKQVDKDVVAEYRQKGDVTNP